jgi:hypothetical protein
MLTTQLFKGVFMCIKKIYINFIFTTFLLLFLFNCGLPGGSTEPAEYLDVTIDDNNAVVTKFVYSLSFMGMVELFASNTATNTQELSDMWIIMFFPDPNTGEPTGSITFYKSEDEFYICNSPVFSITAWGGDKGDNIEGSFTGVVTHYQIVNQQMQLIEENIPLSGEFKDKQDF